jgi:hypothetical protein
MSFRSRTAASVRLSMGGTTSAREVLDEHTHAIIHLEEQDLELEERAVMIVDLEQQLQVL